MNKYPKESLKTNLDRAAFKKILDVLPRIVMLIDLDGNIQYWNGGGVEVFGYSEEDAIGKPVWFLYPEKSKEDFDEEVKHLKSGGMVSGEMKGRHRDGSNVWVDVKRRIITLNDEKIILGSGSDISRQKKVEQELASNEQRLESILDTAVEGIITIDRNGLIQSFNPAAESIFGYQAREVIGQNVKLLMPNPFRSHHDQYIENYLESGKRKIIGIGREVRGKRKDGSIFPMDLSVSEVRRDEELFFTGFVRDLSEKRRLENEILKASEEERQRIGRDLHDGLGQMLTGIGLISQNLVNKLVREDSDFVENAKEIHEMIREADREAKNLAHGLVHIELEEGRFTDAINQLCKRAEKLFQINCELHIENDFEIKDKVTKLHLYRIAQEAVSNAVKHGKASQVDIYFRVKPDHLKLIIRDDGMGFDRPVDLNKLDGIGVRTMYYRAHLLGGHFNIEDDGSNGTRITCTLPMELL